MSEVVYVEGFVAFYFMGDGRWQASYYTYPPSSGSYWRVRIPVPAELLKEEITATVESLEGEPRP